MSDAQPIFFSISKGSPDTFCFTTPQVSMQKRFAFTFLTVKRYQSFFLKKAALTWKKGKIISLIPTHQLQIFKSCSHKDSEVSIFLILIFFFLLFFKQKAKLRIESKELLPG